MKNKNKVKKSRWRFILRNPWGVSLVVFILLSVVNLLLQIYKKPTEVLSVIYEGETLRLEQNWFKYQDIFKAHSTEYVEAETLASIAQVESGGRIWASPKWQWNWTWDYQQIFAPASSALGLMQITSGHMQTVSRYCEQEGKRNSLCEKQKWWSRLLPSHSVHLAAVYMDKTLRGMVKQMGGINNQQRVDVAAITHLCGDKKAWTFVKDNFRFQSFSYCGAHKASRYVGRVKRLHKRLKRL